MPKQIRFPTLLGVDINETESACEIKADVSGFYADNVLVSTGENSLIVELCSKHQPGQSYYLGELEPERHTRVIPLGFNANSKAILTHYNNGKLEILVNKPVTGTLEQTATAA